MLFISRRVYNDLKDARDREVAALKLTIEALAEQVEYLRAVGGRPQPMQLARPSVPMQPLAPGQPPRFTANPMMSEEEEDLHALAENGLMDAEALKAALAELGIDPST